MTSPRKAKSWELKFYAFCHCDTSKCCVDLFKEIQYFSEVSVKFILRENISNSQILVPNMFIIKHTLFIGYYLFVMLDFEEYTKRLELKV